MNRVKFASNWVIFGLFLLFSLLAFGLSFRNGFLGDDSHLLLKNASIHSIFNWPGFFSGGSFYSGGAAKLAGFYYKPILLTTLAGVYTVFGPNAGAFHIFQTLLHAVNGFLVFSLLRKFFSKGLALGLGLLFLVHPANVETVVYVSGIQEPLFLLFGLIALLGRVYFPANWRSNLLVGGALLLSVLSKETGILFVFMIFLYDWFFEKRKLLLTDGGVVAAVAVVYSSLRFLIAGVFGSNQSVAPIMSVGIIGRLMTLPKIFWVSLETIVFPKELAFAQNWVVSKMTIADFWLPTAFLTAIIGAGIYWLLVNFKTLGQHKKLIFFLLWFLFGVGLHLQLIPLDGTFSERWLYFPLVGFIAVIGVALEKILIKKLGKVLPILFFTCLLLFVVRDVIRTNEWRDQYTLYTTDVEKHGGSFILYNGVAQELSDRNDLIPAKKYAEKSIAVFPVFLNWNNLGVIYSKMGKYSEAINAFNESLKFGPYYLAYENMVGTYLLWGKNEEAIKTAEFAMQYFPGNTKLVIFWTAAKYKLGDRQAALQGAEKALQMEDNLETRYVWQTVNNGTSINLGN